MKIVDTLVILMGVSKNISLVDCLLHDIIYFMSFVSEKKLNI